MKDKMSANYQIAVVEVVLKAYTRSEESHGRHDKPLLSSVQEPQHLLHHIIPQHIVPGAVMKP